MKIIQIKFKASFDNGGGHQKKYIGEVIIFIQNQLISGKESRALFEHNKSIPTVKKSLNREHEFDSFNHFEAFQRNCVTIPLQKSLHCLYWNVFLAAHFSAEYLV